MREALGVSEEDIAFCSKTLTWRDWILSHNNTGKAFVFSFLLQYSRCHRHGSIAAADLSRVAGDLKRVIDPFKV